MSITVCPKGGGVIERVAPQSYICNRMNVCQFAETERCPIYAE